MLPIKAQDEAVWTILCMAICKHDEKLIDTSTPSEYPFTRGSVNVAPATFSTVPVSESAKFEGVFFYTEVGSSSDEK